MISDTHEQHDLVVIPKCDVLLHAGDITGRGALGKLSAFNTWIADLEDSEVVGEAVYIAGNHDLSLENNRETAESLLKAGTYLNNTMTKVGPPGEQKTVYGIPQQPPYCDWAFNAEEEDMARLFNNIPSGVDILVTHGPPHGVLDQNSAGIHCGSHSLLRWIKDYKPRLVVCGHIHEGYGIALIGNTLVVNASTCTKSYRPNNQPIVLEL
jgi:Icc-related predicted phosphoesterase